MDSNIAASGCLYNAVGSLPVSISHLRFLFVLASFSDRCLSHHGGVATRNSRLSFCQLSISAGNKIFFPTVSHKFLRVNLIGLTGSHTHPRTHQGIQEDGMDCMLTPKIYPSWWHRLRLEERSSPEKNWGTCQEEEKIKTEHGKQQPFITETKWYMSL